jgi:Tfp pilus assembly protein PilO
MRLKFLFFPISLAISIFIFIGYIWPEIMTVKSINQEYLKNQQDMTLVQNKEAAIQSVAAQLTKSTENQTAVLNYLPTNKSEERILDGLNYIATDAGVTLGNVSIAASSDNSSQSTTGTEDVSGLTQPTLAPTDGAVVATAEAQTPIVPVKLQSTEATIVASGTYDKIRIFAENLQKMNMFNSIKSFRITQGETDPAVLSLEVSVDFNYLAPIKADTQKVAKIQSELDLATIDSLKNYVSKKGSEINIGQTGKANPFLP